MEEIVKCTKLSKKFKDKVALSDVSCKIPKGLTVVLGPNGSGKTTLLRIMAGLTTPDSGNIRVKGIDVKKNPRKVRSLVSYLPQETLIEEMLTVEELLTFNVKLFGASMEKAYRIFERMGLSKEYSSIAGDLSGGMKRKLAVALALLPDRDIYLLDEPFEGLDSGSRIALLDILEEITKSSSVILVSHTVISGIENIANYLVILDSGRLIFAGKPEEFKRLLCDVSCLRLENIDATLLREAMALGVIVSPVESISLIGETDIIEKLASEYGGKVCNELTIGEVYVYMLRRKWIYADRTANTVLNRYSVEN